MVERSACAKGGLAAGAIYGLLTGIVSTAYIVLMKEQVIAQIRIALASVPGGVPITAEDIYPITLISAIPSALIYGVILGAILGMVFSFFYAELMGKNSRMKGLLFSILIIVALAIGEAAAPNHSLGIIMVNTNFLPLAPVGVALFLLFGFLNGVFYDRFSCKKKKRPS
jgi:hypothetical protein